MNYTPPFASRSLSRALLLVAGMTLPLAACPSDPDPAPATGGSGGSSTGGRGGSSGTGGSSGSGGSAGTGGVAGTGGTGGTRPPDAGRPADAPRRDGSAGDRPRNDGGSRDTGNAVGGSPRPSMGCGRANPPAGNRTIMTGTQTGTFIVSLPAGYNPATPYPLGFAFNGFNRTAPQCVSGDCPGFGTLNGIKVFPESFGPGWETPAAELASNIRFFEDLLALVKNEYCVDQSRIFVAGVSSGGQFVEHVACRFGDQLWQATEISAYVDQGVNTNCKGTPAQLIIHGITDQAGQMGQQVSQLYATRNGCTSPLPGLAQARTEMMAAFNAGQAQFRCLDWPGCSSPVRYCLSSQITYSGLTHGWPRVGGMLIQQFQGTLR